MDDETSWQKQLLVGVLALLVVGALIGAIVAFVSLRAASLAGIDETTTPSGTETTIQTKPDPADHQPGHHPHHTTGQPPTEQVPTTGGPGNHSGPASAIVLAASPVATGAYERIDLTGRYRTAPDGTELQVQRKEDGVWATFPTVAHVSDGAFATYVETGHAGLNLFRVTDTGTGRSSNPVTVRIG